MFKDRLPDELYHEITSRKRRGITTDTVFEYCRTLTSLASNMFSKIYGCGIGYIRAAAIGVPPIFRQQMHEQAHVQAFHALYSPVHDISSKDETITRRNVYTQMPCLVLERANVQIGATLAATGHQKIHWQVNVWPAGAK